MRPWIKFHTTMLDDVRLLKLTEKQQLRYMQTYLLAGRLNADGLFIENNERLDIDDIAIKLRVTDRKQFAKDFATLKKVGLIKQNGHGPYIAAFADEQVDWAKKQESDRERKQRQRGNEPVTRDTNVTAKKSRNGHGDVTPLDQTKTKKEIKKKTKKKIKKETTTTTLPSASTKSTRRAKATASPLAGGGGGSALNENFDSELSKIIETNPEAKETVAIMQPILTSSGLGKKKFNNLMVSVATRIYSRDAMRLTLSALASVFADDDVENKPVVAAYRIENEQVPAQFFNMVTWRILPDVVLKAAGINNLDNYIADHASNKHSVSSKVAMMRARSSMEDE